MNGKQAKKIRQLARRESKKAYRETANKTINEFFNYTIKPKPWFLPKWLWLKILGLFLNI